MKINNILIGGCVLLSASPLQGKAESPKQKSKTPNIIFIMADDLGYGDIGCYGQKFIRTPNIDRMALEGIRFTNHYSGAPVSAPARCCLMTGKNLGHSYVRDNFEIKGDVREAGQTPIPENTETIAKMLKGAGYATAVIGKWGLGAMASTGSPLKQGFDFFYGYNDQNHAHNHYTSWLWRNDNVEQTGNPEFTVHPKFNPATANNPDEYKKYYGTAFTLDLMADEALKFIDQNKSKPFFLYLAVVVPHKALQVPDESLQMYNGVFDEKPYNGGAGYTPHPRPYSAYAAMITRMDQKIGNILAKLKELGLDENTIVMFTGDNGPAGGGGTDARFFNSSGGLRGMKGQVYEGGIREPFVVRWPGKIKPGTESTHISAHYDLMATLAEITGQKINATDGISYLPTLLGKSKNQEQHEYLYWEFTSGGGQLAIRMGNLKAVKKNIIRNKQAKWEVYDLAADPAESKDLAEQYQQLLPKFDEIVSRRTPSQNPAWNFMVEAPQKN
ncbi:MAG TPA: arylsulfatase [Bacteroidales bacterium]|jgi:arylsulfatase A-like enzyme|nr:arylsulfatase [Bacteroidales bacterium]